MAQVYEENLSRNMWVGLPKTIPEGQTFIPTELHDVGSVRFLLRRRGLPGTLTVSIRGTIGGLPSGDDLCVGTMDANDIVDNVPGEWYEIFLGEGTKVIAGGMYAIVFSTSAGGFTDWVEFAGSYDNPYPGGARVFTQRHADDWVESAGTDLVFQVLGPGCSGPLVTICEFLRQVGEFLIDLSLDIAEFPLIGGPLAIPFELLGELFYTGADTCCSASGTLKTLLDVLAEGITADSLLALILDNWPTLYYLITDPIDWFLVQLTLAFDLEPWHTQSLEFLAKWVLETYFPALYQIWLDPEDWLVEFVDPRLLAVPVAIAAFLDDPWGWLFDLYTDTFDRFRDRLYLLAEHTIRFFWEGEW